jgi:hypothetical protein
MSVLVGFSKVNLMDILPQNKHCENDILGIGFYLEQEEKKSFFFTVDFMDFDFATVFTLTTAINKELPQAQIHIVTTHNHGGESCTSLDMEKFCLHAKECAKTAIKNAQKAKVKIATASIDEKLTFTRRIFVPTLDSSFTCFYGIDTQKENNAANFVERAIESLKNNALLFTGNGSTENQNNSSITFFDADPNISVIEFQTLNNQPIGNIVRFASHAVCCNLPDCYSSDFPGYLRKNMENSLGGISLFFNGPCAEIAPVIPCKSIDAAKKIADILSQKALELLEKTSFSNLEDFSDTIWQIPLPVREEIINNNVEANQILENLTNLRDKKNLLEKQRVKAIMPFLQGIHKNGINNPNNNITVSTALLKLGKFNLLFFSGETFSCTANEIISQFQNEKFITITEHGRTAMYIPPKEEYRRGGYEPTCATVSNLGEKTLKDTMIKNLENYFSK